MGGRGSYYGTTRKSNVISVEEWKKRITDWRNKDYMKPEDRPKKSTFLQQKEIRELLKTEKDANKRRAYQQSVDNYKKAFDLLKAEKDASKPKEKQYKTSPEIEALRRKASAWHDEVVKRSWALTGNTSWLNGEVKRAEEMAQFSGQKFDRAAYIKMLKKNRKQAENELTQIRKEYHDLKAQIKRMGGKTIDL
ncbi:hypothetical protein lacNasYZ03_11570 [Lactobacillus nasalidis]|uniref:Uncharacterized protein n=1 Tax=Lactobacillus nasalidis TaxID=2797258 RepID=A0ABQ3W7Y7_9LACO|nr:hypothetical protein [Lactobacillus nasalidis]GHV97881.1 hypothetical protein lacNasYZ01_10630 [Lactobacillus nasalidis]GHW00111.1 hypothetical protein lacNasYZ02_15400 [Lactobacillus nasalidis]GHW01470.1 hypothetical protein lacNasYZ03_11570 [Lactobacillus nasalidis]